MGRRKQMMRLQPFEVVASYQSRSIAGNLVLRGVKRTAFGPIRDRALEKDLARYPVDIHPARPWTSFTERVKTASMS